MRKLFLFLSSALLLGCVKEAEEYTEFRNAIMNEVEIEDFVVTKRHIQNTPTSELCRAIQPLQAVTAIFWINDEKETVSATFTPIGDLSPTDPINVSLEHLHSQYDRWREASIKGTAELERRGAKLRNSKGNLVKEFDAGTVALSMICGDDFVSRKNLDALMRLDAERENNLHNSIKNAGKINSVRPSISCSSTLIGTQSVSTRCY